MRATTFPRAGDFGEIGTLAKGRANSGRDSAEHRCILAAGAEADARYVLSGTLPSKSCSAIPIKCDAEVY